MIEANQHYKIHKPEPLELIQRYNLSFVEGNVVKYVLRSPFKGDSKGDLEKAMVYAQLLQDIGFYRQFEASELDQYTELNAIEKEIVCDVLRADVTCTVQKLQKAIGIRGMENVKKALTKRFEPDWLPPHPLYTLLELVDEHPHQFLYNVKKKRLKNTESSYAKVYDAIIRLIQGGYELGVVLEELQCGSKDFWKNRYLHYFKKRNRPAKL